MTGISISVSGGGRVFHHPVLPRAHRHRQRQYRRRQAHPGHHPGQGEQRRVLQPRPGRTAGHPGAAGIQPARPDPGGKAGALFAGHPAGPRPGRLRRQGAESGRHRCAVGAAGPAVRTAAAQSRRSPRPKPSFMPPMPMSMRRARSISPRSTSPAAPAMGRRRLSNLFGPAGFAWNIGACVAADHLRWRPHPCPERPGAGARSRN